jgi:hypothetical protein
MAGRKAAQEQRRQGDQTWLRPPRAVVERIEALLELGKGNTAIRNHSTLADYDISEAQVTPECWRGYPGPRTMPKCRINKTTRHMC